jgi:dephospho-CoA kinase
MTGFVVGLTGGIGSGKSAAAERFAALGAAVVDTDAIAHELTAPGGAAMPALRTAFGDAIAAADGGLDRPAMRAQVFADATARARLEAILHPLIRAAAESRCAAALAAGTPYVVLVVPLLVETGSYRERLARIAVVDCDEAIQLARVMARSALGREDVLRIMAAQASRQQRLAAADDVIANDGELQQLWRQVEILHGRYREMAATCGRG